MSSMFTENMKRVPKKHSRPSLSTRDKIAAHFCIFPKAELSESSPDYAPVYLNVYDLTPANGYMYWAGLGIFHTGIEVHGAEYAFGAHDFPTSGVFEIEPRQCPGFKFRKSIFMGTTSLDASHSRQFMEQQSRNYHGDMYHLITKNCNHFCDDICYQLTGKKIPKWVNRLARIGSSCNCILPDSLKVTTVPEHDDSNLEAYEEEEEEEEEEEKHNLRSFRCFSSFSMSHKEEMLSPLFLPRQYSESLPPWEPRRAKSNLL